jgi:hypothetical protein
MQHRFKPPLKEGTNSPIEPVEPSAIGQVLPLDRLTQVRLGRLELQMIMVSHQDVAVDFEAETTGSLSGLSVSKRALYCP